MNAHVNFGKMKTCVFKFLSLDFAYLDSNHVLFWGEYYPKMFLNANLGIGSRENLIKLVLVSTRDVSIASLEVVRSDVLDCLSLIGISNGGAPKIFKCALLSNKSISMVLH